MPKRASLPVVLTIAGSDSGGGAGIQADLKTFAALGVHGTSVITCLTAQNPKGVRGVQATRPRMVWQQLEAVFAELPPAAAKTGMLYSTAIVAAVAEFFQTGRRPPLIVDPVMVATSGSRLLQPSAIRALTNQLLPQAMLVTPNLHEASLLVDYAAQDVEGLRRAARDIHRRWGCAALVKGGHLRNLRQAVDIFYDGQTELLLTAPWIRGLDTHGTGCTYSAAITAYLAKGLKLPVAVQRAKQFITQAIFHSHQIARHTVLNSYWKQNPSARGR